MLSRQNVVLVLAIAGLGIAAYLTFVAFDDHVQPFCSGVGNCEAVQSSQYADIGGIPIATFGLLMYAGLVGLIVLRRTWSEAPPFLGAWTFALAFSGMLYSAYLTLLELFVIDAICVWCVTSAVVVTAICALSWPDLLASRRALEG